MKDHKSDTRIYLLNGQPINLADFLEQDFEDDQVREDILALEPGGVVMIGGGAAHLFELRCEAAEPAAVEPPLGLEAGRCQAIHPRGHVACNRAGGHYGPHEYIQAGQVRNSWPAAEPAPALGQGNNDRHRRAAGSLHERGRR